VWRGHAHNSIIHDDDVQRVFQLIGLFTFTPVVKCKELSVIAKVGKGRGARRRSSAVLLLCAAAPYGNNVLAYYYYYYFYYVCSSYIRSGLAVCD